MSVWKVVKEKERYGIAIHNFNDTSPHRIKLSYGETVHILQECGDWYYGFCSKARNCIGIFPKTYVRVADCTVDRTGNYDVVVFKQPYIVQEITTVLREWWSLWKHLYITNSGHFEQIQKQIYELIKYRSKILSGTLPVDELRDIKQLVTSKIDTGNKILGLDMVVRDDQGNILNPELTSTLQLYNQHVVATERIRRATSGTKRKVLRQGTQYSHIFFVSVRNFVCKMYEDCELLMTLYDAKEQKAVTENYVVHWSKQGLTSDIDLLHNLKVLFTDLGSRDLQREKIYLVCYVIRVGAMDSKEIDHRRSSVASQMGSTISKKGHFEGMRRPFGVAAMDVTPFLWEKMEGDEDKHHFVPFIPCEKDNLDSTLRKILVNKDQGKTDNRGQGLWVSVKLLHGDIKQVREENPHLVLGSVSVARKMGFPEVIMPGDVRNDLYLTLMSGEFSKGAKSTDKNVEVTVTVCNERGAPIPGVITLGGGVHPLNEYRSVIYYHEDKPRWQETFKVEVPIDEFKASHLKFLFKHRSSNEAKDKNEKPFAMSYVHLMQPNGTTLADKDHNLLVYKIDHKKFNESDLNYLTLPSCKSDLKEGQAKPSIVGLSLSSKDSFSICTNVCSTKLTQNVDLLGLLNWVSHKDTLKDSLLALMKVDGEEVVKFLQDVLDALFNILVQNDDCSDYDTIVFQCLLNIIHLVSDRKYQHFQPVLDLYIKESFSATLAYNKLIIVLKDYIDNASMADSHDLILLRTMKSLQYCIKFVVRSRLLFAELYGGKDNEEFHDTFEGLLKSIISLMCSTTDGTLLTQGACLKYLPSTIPDIIQVFNPRQLSVHIIDLITIVPSNRLTKQKMMTVHAIVESALFRLPECRAVLLPMICQQVKELLELREEGGRVGVELRKIKSNAKVAKVLGASKRKLHDYRGKETDEQEMELCVKILSDTLDLLFKNDLGPTLNDISVIMMSLLRTVIQTTIAMDRDKPMVGNLVAVMIAIFRQMTSHQYEQYISHFSTRIDLLDFLMEILLVFKDLVSRPVFPTDWCDMIMLQNSVILKSLRHFSHTTRDYFFTNFDHQAWSNFFHCSIAFLTQPALQVDSFSHSKRARILSRYKDMRRETAFEIRSMWFNLGQYKTQFVPALVGSVLEMTLIPDAELRKATIPIFFDMMQCEYYSSKHIMESYGDTKRDSSHIKGHFSEVENEMIAKLDILVEGGRGDEHYAQLFSQIMLALCEGHSSLRAQGVQFVKTVTRLMERLLEYRCIINDENKENRMACTVSLLDFYSEINRKEMYIRYVNKLCDLHVECDNYTEAAYTLRLHSKLLNWSDVALPPLLKSHKYSHCHTHRELKEALYYNIIDYYDKGKMWECALEICKELVSQYEDEIYDYAHLHDLLIDMAKYYENIMKQIRPEPEYFRVAYYGRGFPMFLQNKVFIYRGKEYERLSDFCSRTLNMLPNAELMQTLTPPGDDIKESSGQHVQINKVEPVMEDRRHRFSGKPVNDQILKYHRVNDIQTFRFSRPFHQKESNLTVDQNEFANLWLERTVLTTSYPLPGILRWFPVISSETFNVSPLRNAIETMESANKSLRDLIIGHRSDANLPLNPLSMKLNGIVDAAVMGGVTNYEKAFFTPEYTEAHPEDAVLIQKIQDLIAMQIPLLELGITLHKQKAPASLQPLNNRLEECFGVMRTHVEAKYGKRTSDLKLDREAQVTMRRHLSRGQPNGETNNRLSEASIGSSDGSGRPRLSSLTRSQVTSSVTTLRSFTSSFNFTNMSPAVSLARASLSNAQKSMLSPTSSPSPSKVKREKEKTPVKRRSSRKLDRESLSLPLAPLAQSQWYTSVTPDRESNPSSLAVCESPKVELTEELTPKRPLRSEVEREKRLSRPASGQFPNSSSSANSQTSTPLVTNRELNGSPESSNRNSVDSTTSEEDLRPPPLPLKSREMDYANLPPVSIVPFPNTQNDLPVLSPTARTPDKTPPTPPPKPQRPSKAMQPYPVTDSTT